MNLISRTITGILAIAFGLFLIILSFFSDGGFWIVLIWGVSILIIGFFILFNKKEDEIEKINYSRRKK